jgi:nucleotide-binding universal stress UspA family protein
VSTDSNGAPREVIVAVDYHSQLLPAVEVAIALANARRLAVHGLCIEDPDLAIVSSLPFTQEVTLLGGRSRALEEQHLRRTLEGFARRFRQLLSERAEQAALDFSFGSVHGRRQAMEMGGSPKSHYLVLGQRRPAREPGRPALRVLLLCGDLAAALPVLEAVSSNGGRPLELLLVNTVGGAEGGERFQQFVADHREVGLGSGVAAV